MKLAYLLSEYPTLGHTYLLREVRQLRELGWDIQTISIRRPGNRPSPLSRAEAEELGSTWYILGSGLSGSPQKPCGHTCDSSAALCARPDDGTSVRPLQPATDAAGDSLFRRGGVRWLSAAQSRYHACPLGLFHHGCSNSLPGLRHQSVDHAPRPGRVHRPRGLCHS